MSTQPVSIGYKALVVFAFAMSAFGGWNYFFREPFSVGSLTYVSGKVTEVTEYESRSRRRGGTSRFMEMRLRDQPQLFRIPISVYGMVPDRAAFIKDLQSRPWVTLGVDPAELRDPGRPVTGTLQPAVFVSTISTRRREYVNAASWAAWDRDQHAAARTMLLAFFAIGFFLYAFRHHRLS